MREKPRGPLRRGWTTGACATAAAKAAYAALLTGEFPDPVEIALPRGERPSFALATTRRDKDFATAGIVKDAGDDPDVTHGALVLVTVGGLSILGTTGIVIPYSCSSWIHSIRSGIDVARAMGVTHIAGATGATSESAVQKLYGLPETALIDMGEFVGGMLKYLRSHPVPRVTIAGGVAKMTKLAQGLLDLHSKRGAVDLAA